MRFVALDDSTAVRPQNFICFVDSLFESAQELRSNLTLDSHNILFANAKTRMGEMQRESAIIRVKDQAFALVIEPADRIKIGPFFWQKIMHRFAPARIFARADIARRLIDR